MRKHIIGLAIFSLIVSAAAIVYAVFNVPKIIQVREVVVRKITKNNTIEIKQAVLNVKTREFNCELYIPETSAQIDLQFFKKNDQGTHYLTTEKVSVVSVSYGVITFNKSYDWMDNPKSFENLYVIAQFTSELENYQGYDNKVQPKFDIAKAIPVTIDYGK